MHAPFPVSSLRRRPGRQRAARGLRRALLCLAILGWAAPALRAADPAPSPSPSLSPHEAIRQAVDPIVDVFARSPDGSNHAVSLRLRLAEASNQPPELQGSVLAFRCQPPDQLFCQFAAVGTILTIKRQGQQVWVGPASRLRPLLDEAAKAPPTEADKKPLSPLRLKLPKTLLWLGFRFVGVRDAGNAPLDGVSCRRFDFDPPADDDDKSAKPDRNRSMRLWVTADRSQLRRLDWHSSESHGTLLIEETKLSPGLPADALQPDSAAARADLMELPVPRFRQLMRLVNKEEEKRAKAQVEQQRHAAGEAVPR